VNRDKYLTEKEVKRLMQYAEKRSDDDHYNDRKFYVRAWILLEVLFGTGIRASELRMIKIEDLNLSKEPTLTVLGKGNRKRTIEIGEDLAALLDGFLLWKDSNKEPMEDDDYVFINRLKRPWSLSGIQKLFKKMAKEAGLRSCYSVHSSRHSYGYMMYRKTKNIRLVQSLLGHRSLKSTEIYTHVDPEERARAVNNIWN